MKKYRLGIIGCGYLGNVIVDAYLGGLLEDYELVGAYGRTAEHAEAVAGRVTAGDETCAACKNVEELLMLKPDLIVEVASVQCMRDTACQILETGCSLVTVSVGALADDAFRAKAAQTAREHGSRIYIASGAVGGFDVLRTISLMGKAKGEQVEASFVARKAPQSLQGTPLFEEHLIMDKKPSEVFSDHARRAIELLPTKVNVAVATALATVGTEQLNVEINSVPGMAGDDYDITTEISGYQANIGIYSETSEIAAWSVVAVLRNITSPIVF